MLEDKGEGQCQLLMYPKDMSESIEYKWVVGDKFLQNFYTIFDAKQKRVALLAPK